MAEVNDRFSGWCAGEVDERCNKQSQGGGGELGYSASEAIHGMFEPRILALELRNTFLQQIYPDLMITSTPASFIDVDLCWSASMVVIIKYVGRGFLVALKIDVDVETEGRVAWKRSTKYQGRSVLRLKEASVTLRERS